MANGSADSAMKPVVRVIKRFLPVGEVQPGTSGSTGSERGS